MIAMPLITETHLPKQRILVQHVLGLTGTVKPRIIVFYGKHAPLEPMDKVAEAIAQRYSPDQVLTVKVPDSHTPLGQALEAEAVMAQIHQRLLAGETLLPDFSAADHADFAAWLTRFSEIMAEDDLALADMHRESFLAGSGLADDKIREHLIARLSPIRKKDEDFLAALQGFAPVAPEEELLVEELAPLLPGVHFLSLHGGFKSSETYQLGLPDKEVHSTRSAGGLHLQVTRALNSFGRYIPYGWSLKRLAFVSSHLRDLLNWSFVNDQVNFAYFELPQSLRETSPLSTEVLVRAIAGAYLLPNPFLFEIVGKHLDPMPKEIDYFRQTSESRVAEHVEAMTDYLDLLLEAISGNL